MIVAYSSLAFWRMATNPIFSFFELPKQLPCDNEQLKADADTVPAIYQEA